MTRRDGVLSLTPAGRAEAAVLGKVKNLRIFLLFGMQDLSSLTREQTCCPSLHWKCGVLTNEPQGTSPLEIFDTSEGKSQYYC